MYVVDENKLLACSHSTLRQLLAFANYKSDHAWAPPIPFNDFTSSGSTNIPYPSVLQYTIIVYSFHAGKTKGVTFHKTRRETGRYTLPITPTTYIQSLDQTRFCRRRHHRGQKGSDGVWIKRPCVAAPNAPTLHPSGDAGTSGIS